MSDLAPFVAAALRDKVVMEMEQEIQELQKRLTYGQTIEIVRESNDSEEIIYATGLLQDGVHQAKCSQLHVTLSATKKSCPLRELPNLSVRIGGIHKANLRAIAHNGFMRAEECDTGSSKYMKFQGADVCLEFQIEQWPREQWTPLVDIGHILMGDNLLTNLVQAAQRCPQAVVSFKGIAVDTQQVRGALQNLPRSTRLRLQNEAEKEKRRQQYKDYLKQRMRHFGYQGRTAVGREEIMDVLVYGLQIRNANNERDREVIDLVIRLHKDAQSTPNPDEAFHEGLRRNVRHLSRA